MSRPAVFLDRDGVLTRARVEDGTPVPPRRLEDMLLIEGAQEACDRLADAGLVLVVATNQPDVSRGSLDPAVLAEMHARLAEALPVTEVLVCPHDDADHCPCRKPAPGMILDAAARHDLDLHRSVMVGDRWRDIDAATNAGIASVYVEWGQPEPLNSAPGAVFGSLAESVDHLLAVTGVRATTTSEETTC